MLRLSRRTARGSNLPDGSHGSLYGLPCWVNSPLGIVKCVRQRDLLDCTQFAVLVEVRIDKICHRHLDGLIGRDRLLGKTEALDLVEVYAARIGSDIKTGGRSERLICQVRCAIDNCLDCPDRV